MPSVFVKVLVKDELPSMEGCYVVSCVDGYVSKQYYSKSFFTKEMEWSCSNVDWWLKEIELPNDEYLKYDAKDLGLENEEVHGFEIGAKFILNHIDNSNQHNEESEVNNG